MLNYTEYVEDKLRTYSEIEERVPVQQMGRIVGEILPRHCLVETQSRFDSSTRVYEIVPVLERKYGYHSHSSGGQEHWTDQEQGPDGEEIDMYREWLLACDDSYIGSFISFRHALVFIAGSLGRTIGEVVYA